jgi:hypothetical protein
VISPQDQGIPNMYLSVLLFIVFLLTGMEHHMLAQEHHAGFTVEIYESPESQPVLQSFIDLEYMKSLPPDTILIKDKHGKSHSWIGVSLFNIIEDKFGIDHTSISKLAATAPDGYNSVVSESNHAEIKTAFITYKLLEEKDWEKKYGKFRLVFPNIREMYFVSNPEKILLYKTKLKEAVKFQRFYSIDADIFKSLAVLDKNSVKTISVKKFLEKLNLSGSNFNVITADGLEREYINNNLIDKLEMKTEKDGTWKISGAKVPLGLRTRKIFYVHFETVGILLKPLDDDEVVLWEKQFQKRISDSKNILVELVLLNGEKHKIDFIGEASIYKTIKKQLELFPESDYFQIFW